MTDNKEIAYIFIRYISVTLLNEKRSYIKKKNNQHVMTDQNDLLDNLPSKEISYIETADYHTLENYVNSYDLANAIASLSSAEKHLLYEKYVLSKKDIEIAKQLNISSQAISKRKRKILDKIRKFFQK